MKKLVPSDVILIPDIAELAFQGELFGVYQWQQELYDGSHATFEMLRRPDTTQVLAIVDGKLIILKDDQPNRGTKLTFPGGRIDPEDESTLAAAQRELKEETGYTLENWKLLEVSQPAGKMEWFIYVYVAWGEYTKREPKLDAGEKIEVTYQSLQDVQQLVADGHSYVSEQTVLTEGQIQSLDDIIALPEYSGREIDR